MTPEIKIKELQNKINRLESGSMKSLCNVTTENKKLFKIALRRYDNRFESTSQFVKWCIKQQTGMDFKEFCEIGR
jgi:hypothetical protein